MTSDIDRINALTQTSRTTWFALLGVLTFVGVTLLSIQPIDFYDVDRATQLPIVGIAILTRQFTVFAPLITAVFFCYFHVQLIRLWDAVALAPAQPDGQPLAHSLSPWLILDLALQLRNWRLNDGCTTRRALDWVSSGLNVILAWVFGLAVGFANWWWPMVARDLGMSLMAAAAFLAMLLCAYASLWVMWHRMGGDRSDAPTHLFRSVPAATTGLLALPLVLILTHSRTHEPSGWIPLAPLDLTGENIVEHPADWLPTPFAREDFRDIWCKRAMNDCTADQDLPAAFTDEWQTRRTAALNALKKPTWSAPNEPRPDLRGAKLMRTFLSGANLSGALMDGANFNQAQMDGANFNQAQMDGAKLKGAQLAGANFDSAQLGCSRHFQAQMDLTDLSDVQDFINEVMMFGGPKNCADLSGAQMDGANFSFAQMDGANLSGAQMEGADLRRAQLNCSKLARAQTDTTNLNDVQHPLIEALLFGRPLNCADLSGAQMDGANLSGAQMNGADLSFAQMDGADLRRARMNEAGLSRAQMNGADLSWAQMDGAKLRWALLTGTSENRTVLKFTNLSASINNGGALRFVDVTDAVLDDKTDWRNAFFDSSVIVPTRMRDQIGQPCLWDWIETQNAPLSDTEFFGHWRGWLKLGRSWNDRTWRLIAPKAWRDVPALDPPAGCR